jgi:hypothetical protein
VTIPLGRRGHRWEDNIRMDFSESVDWIGLDEVRFSGGTYCATYRTFGFYGGRGGGRYFLTGPLARDM